MDRLLLPARRAVAASLLAAVAGSATTFAQDVGPPVDLPPPLSPEKPKADDVFLASDGEPAAAGRIPAGTPEDAAGLWQLIGGSLAVEGEGDPSTEAPRAFELELDVRNRQKSGTQNFLARFSYLDVGPGLVRGVVLDNSGRARSTQMRGFGSNRRLQYWYRKDRGEGQTEGWVRQTRRDNAEGRAQIDSWAAISYDIARLTRPNSFRIIELRERRLEAATDDAPPGLLRFEGDPAAVQLPATDIEGVREGTKRTVADLCAGLRWLELTTPDFRDFRESALAGRVRDGSEPSSPAVYRLVFGVEPKTGRPQVAIVSPGSDGPIQIPGTVLLQCSDWFLHPPEGTPDQQSWLPGRFFAYETVEAPRGAPTVLRFADVPTTDLFLLGGTMRAALTLEDFAPR